MRCVLTVVPLAVWSSFTTNDPLYRGLQLHNTQLTRASMLHG